MATRLKFIGVVHQHKLIPQLLFCFDMRRIFQNSIGNRAHLLAGWRVVMAYAFRTLIAVNLVNAITHRNRLIRAFGLAHIAIDTAFSN